jgi:hypothetical protein
MDGASSTNGEKQNVYRLLVEKQERKIPLGRWRHMWADNKDGSRREDKIDVYWRDGMGGTDWIGVT